MPVLSKCLLQKLCIVLMVMAEIGIINGTAVILHIQSTLPAMYQCQFNDEQFFSCKVFLCVISKASLRAL